MTPFDRVFNADNPRERMELRNRSMIPTLNEVLPRDYDRHPVGSFAGIPQVAAGDEFGAPDVLIPEGGYEEAIEYAHAQQIFPQYAQNNSWAPEWFQYNQNGLGYCWTWGGTACCMDLQQIHCQDVIKLAPVSMGFLVGWANRGNYLESYIRGARETGICAAIDGNINDHRNRSSVWDSQPRPVRLDKVWDIDTRSGDDKAVQMLLSCLCYGCPIYIAYNWWGHALEMVGLIWDKSKPRNLIYVIRNSHNESDFILLEGNKGIPDEMYAMVSLKLAA